jgi:hypothetical protein
MILGRAGTDSGPRIPLFISIASPWNGVKAARLAVELFPPSVWAWDDLAPGAGFLTRLFYDRENVRRRLPPATAHYLIFAAESGGASDGRVSVKSQLRREATEDAAEVYGIPQSHTGVLSDSRTSALVNRLLAEAIRPDLPAREARLTSADPPGCCGADSGAPARSRSVP